MQLQYLKVAENQITVLPEALGQLQNLETLILDKNPLWTLPRGITQLKKLKKLSLKKCYNLNWEQALPLICQLPALEELWLESNSIAALPVALGKLLQLKKLDVSDNQLLRLPESVGLLAALEHLNVDNNNLEALPESIGQLQQLQQLRVSRNKIKALPASLCRLPHLQDLTIWNNALQTLPPEITELRHIKDLFLAENQLKELPDEICHMHWLRRLSLRHNRLKKLPDSFFLLGHMGQIELSENRLTALPTAVANSEYIYEIDLSKNPELDWEDTFTKLLAFPRLRALSLKRNKLRQLPASLSQLMPLEALDLSENADLDLDDTLAKLHQLPNLRRVSIYNAKINQIPPSIALIRPEVDLNIDWSSRLDVYKIEEKRKELIERGYSILERQLLLLLHTNAIAQAAELAHNHLSLAELLPWLDTGDRNLTMSLLGLLEAILPDPLQSERDLTSRVWILAGRYKAFTLEILRQKLKEAGIRVTNVPEEATHVLIGAKGAKPATRALDKGAVPVLEAHLKAWLTARDTPFLLEENAEQSQLTANVVALLRSEEATNVEIGLQMLEGGGVSRPMMSAVMALHLWHNSAAVRKLAARLFGQYASPDWQAHVKAIWTKDFRKRKMLKESQWIRLLENLLAYPDVDKAMATEITWCSARKGAYLVLRYGTESTLDALRELRYGGRLLLKYVNGYLAPEFFTRIAQFEELSELPPLEILDLSGSGLTSLPEEIRRLSHLKELYLSKVSFSAPFRRQLQEWLPHTGIYYKRYRP